MNPDEKAVEAGRIETGRQSRSEDGRLDSPLLQRLGKGLLESGRPAPGPVVGAGRVNIGLDRNGYHPGPEEPPEHADHRLEFSAPLQRHDGLRAAKFHLVVLQGLTTDPGDHAGRVDDDGIGRLASLLDQGGGGNDLLKDQSLGADSADEMKGIGPIELGRYPDSLRTTLRETQLGGPIELFPMSAST